MKKAIRKILTCLLVSMLLATFFVSTAGATVGTTEVNLYVNESLVEEVEIYDIDGAVYVASNDDIAKIFTAAEIGDIFQLPTANGILLEPIATKYGYLYLYSGNNVYLTKVSDSTNSSDNEQPAVSPKDSVEVFVNGLRLTGVTAYLSSNGKACINDTSNLYKLFPKETVDTYFTTELEETTLASWAERYGYAIVQNGNRVYLNNDGKTPIEVTLNGTLVKFEDQQAVVVPPGRTLVPIRAISEILECDVTWDPDYNRVIIRGNKLNMVLWLNDQTYWLNGKYYESDVAPILYNNRTMVPLRLVSEAYGLDVDFKSGVIGTATLES